MSFQANSSDIRGCSCKGGGASAEALHGPLVVGAVRVARSSARFRGGDRPPNGSTASGDRRNVAPPPIYEQHRRCGPGRPTTTRDS